MAYIPVHHAVRRYTPLYKYKDPMQAVPEPFLALTPNLSPAKHGLISLPRSLAQD